MQVLLQAEFYVFSQIFTCFQHGACVNAMDLWQFTPLHEAASKNRVEVCSLLLSHGADPTLVNCHGKSAVDMAPTPELKERLTCKYNSDQQFIKLYLYIRFCLYEKREKIERNDGLIG